MLDHKSPHYIAAPDGGLGTKQVVFLANFIVGRPELRGYDDNWAIVMEDRRRRLSVGKGGAKPAPPKSR
jgi:hypothetical protein